MISDYPIKPRRVQNAKHWSPEAKDTILQELDKPGATAKDVAARFNGLLDGGRSLNENQVKRILMSRSYVRSERPKHVWSQESTDLLIHHVVVHNLPAPEVAKMFHLKLDGGQPLTAAKIRGLVFRHDPEAKEAARRKQEMLKDENRQGQGKDKVRSGPSSPILRFLHTGGEYVPQARGLPSKPELPINGHHTLSHLFLVNLGDNQCRLICSETTEGDVVCCGKLCAERPAHLRGSKGRYYSYCSDHIQQLQKAPSSRAANQVYEAETLRYSRKRR